MVFRWLKDKINKSQSNEFDRGCERTLNFLAYAKARPDAHDSDIVDMDMLINKINRIKMNKEKDTPACQSDMDILLEVDMICRRIWANVFKESNFSYDKRFNP